MNQRVLYIDDEPDLRAIVEMALELDQTLEVRTCANGSDGLTVAAEWRPDLVLLDVMMPGLDGPETSRRLRADPATQAIPFVFITASARASEIAELYELGAAGVIAKPFDPMTLSDAVREYLPADA